MQADIIKLEDKITSIIKTDGKTVHFDYSDNKTESFFSNQSVNYTVSAYTFNSKSGETFLLKTVVAKSPIQALEAILDYVTRTNESSSSYTVEWCKKENGRLGKYNISYFYCKNPKEVLDKFYSGKNEDDYEIFLLKLNPIA